MPLPLLLAGPILRRVESNLVTVWLALSQDAMVTLSVWEGRVPAGAGTPFVSSAPERTWRIGDQLHLGLVTARIPETSGKSFQPDVLYSYDVAITAGGSTHTLQSLHMLRDASAADSPDGMAHAALGYEADQLPSFAPPPSQLSDLRILYGSCRRPGHRDPDAMVWIDDDVADHVADPRARPHQLFLGGDQIYADDVDALFMFGLMDLAIELIGTDGTGMPKERVRVDQIVRRKPSVPTPDPNKLFDAYVLEVPNPTGDAARLPIDKAHFPPGHRLELTKRAAKFTSSDGSSHLISLGEFAAMYLLVWSNACWTDAIPGATFVADIDNPGQAQPLHWSSPVTKKSRIDFPALTFPERVPRHLFPEPDPNAKPATPPSPAAQQEQQANTQKSRRRSHRRHAEFFAGLPRVRRALANIPTYMIFDDHDVTDDFYLNPMWRDRVLSTALGQTILLNGMLSYALFQDWGNNPLRYDSGLPAELRTRALELFPAGATAGPAQAPFERLAQLFAHDQRNQPTADGRYSGLTPPILWHFTVDGPTHRVIALDNRTRRSYGSRLGPPGNVSFDALVDQIPPPPLPAGRKVLVVIAPLQVLGAPVLDDLVAPLAYRVFDLAAAIKDEDLSTRSMTGLRQMTGTHPDAIEAWAFDVVTFEHLLERLEPYQQVVLLSGDVHNSAGAAMSYWRGAAVRPARIVQFTSSGFKNVMPTMIIAVDRSAAFAQQMVRANLGTERIGWDRPQDDLVLLPPGRTPVDLVPNMRARLVSTPVTDPDVGVARRQRSRSDGAVRPDQSHPAEPGDAPRLALAPHAAARPTGRRRSARVDPATGHRRRPGRRRPRRSGDRGERVPGDRRPPPARPRPPPQRPPDPLPQQLRRVPFQRAPRWPARGRPRGVHRVRRPGQPGGRGAQGRGVPVPDGLARTGRRGTPVAAAPAGDRGPSWLRRRSSRRWPARPWRSSSSSKTCWERTSPGGR